MATTQHKKIFSIFPSKRKKSPILKTAELKRNSVPHAERRLRFKNKNLPY